MMKVPHEEALGRLLELVVMISEDMTQSLARDGLTQSRAHVLWELRRQGPSVQRVLADACGVTARTMTGLVDGLAGTGFVTREPHPTDRRAALVTLTPHGTEIIEKMEREQADFTKILFGGMTERRYAGLVTGIGEVVSRLRVHGLSAAAPEDRP